MQRLPAPPDVVARVLPEAARHAGWDVYQGGGATQPWVLRLDWAFHSAGIWTRVVIEPDGQGSIVRYAALLRNTIDQVEDVNGNTRLLMGWVVLTLQRDMLARGEVTP